MRILVAGGAGYVGSVLVPKLLQAGHEVTVLDLMIYGDDVLPKHSNLHLIKGDVRNQKSVSKSLFQIDCVIHLACISNDPSFDLDPELGKTINFDSFEPFVKTAIEQNVSRFIFASSSSVYGVRSEPEVTEELKLNPLTPYSLYKAKCEAILLKYQSDSFTTAILRPATVCGVSPRQRLDLIVNIFSNLAYNKGNITVFGGSQKRPNIHIDDITDLYLQLCTIDKKMIAGKIYNVGTENLTTKEIATKVSQLCQKEVMTSYSESDDLRSYHINSQAIERDLQFKCKKTIGIAIEDLLLNFEDGPLSDPLNNPLYYNIKRMQEIGLK